MIGNIIWHMQRFCCESLSNIENYDKAVAKCDNNPFFGRHHSEAKWKGRTPWNKLKSDKCADESLNNTNTHKRG